MRWRAMPATIQSGSLGGNRNKGATKPQDLKRCRWRSPGQQPESAALGTAGRRQSLVPPPHHIDDRDTPPISSYSRAMRGGKEGASDFRLRVVDCRFSEVGSLIRIYNLQSEISSDCVLAAPHLYINQAKVRALAIVTGFDGDDVLV